MKKLVLNEVQLKTEEKEFLEALKNKLSIDIYLVKDVVQLKEELKGRDFLGIKIEEDHVEEFILYSEKSINFPFEINIFKLLKKLRLNGLIFSYFYGFNTFADLEYLDLSFCHFQPTHNNIIDFAVQKLKYLDLSYCNFNRSFTFSKESSEIHTLKIKSIIFKQSPERFHHLVNLEYLDYSNNPNLSISPEIFKLKKLKSLNLSHTKLNKEELNFEQLENLQEIHLSSLELTEVPPSLGNLKDLEKIDIAFNALTKIPDYIFELKKLLHLDLSHNQISQIPDNISNLINLNHFNINFNIIGSIPESFSKLENLKEFYAIHNQINSLPDSFKELNKLEILYLTNNDLVKFPQFVKNLPNLKKLFISDNPIEDFYEVYSLDLKLSKKIKLKELELTNIYSFKNADFKDFNDLSILIGTNNSGKSNLIKTFLNIKPFIPLNQIPDEFVFTDSEINQARIKLIFEFSDEFFYNYFENMKIIYPQLRYVSIESLELKYQDKYVHWRDVLARIIVELNFHDNFIYIEKFGFQFDENFINLISYQYFNDANSNIMIKSFTWRKIIIELNKEYLIFAGDNFQEINLAVHQIDSVEDVRNYSIKNINIISFFWREIIEFYGNISYISEFRNFKKDANNEINPQKISKIGDNFPIILTDYCNNVPKNRDFLFTLLNKLYPDVKKLWTNLRGSKTIPFIVEFNNMKRTFENVGKGMHQILIILTQLMQLETNSTLFIEEPELYIHPELQKKLLEIIRRFLPLHQVFITSHSPFFVNSFEGSMSIHEIHKKKGESIVKNVDSENITEVYSHLGLEPSDLLMYNGLILVEGKSDIKLLKNLLAEFLISYHLEVIPFEGKNKLHFFADHKILSNLIDKGFKILIVLDKDEGNKKIIKTLPETLRDYVLLLPVREVENLYINPNLITKFLKRELLVQSSESKLEQEIIKLIDQLISKEIIDRTIRKSFLDEIPFFIHYKDKDILMDIDCDNKKWLEMFFYHFESNHWIENFKKENFEKLFDKKKEFYNKIDKKEKWKYFPGKKLRSLLFEKLKEKFDKSISLEKLEERMKDNIFIENELLSRIRSHFTG